jgi:hypothetical protein
MKQETVAKILIWYELICFPPNSIEMKIKMRKGFNLMLRKKMTPNRPRKLFSMSQNFSIFNTMGALRTKVRPKFIHTNINATEINVVIDLY